MDNNNLLPFDQLKLSPEILKAVAYLGFKTTTPIQSQAIPDVLEGRDVVGLASTGTGKTAAFMLPAIEKINPISYATQVLVLCPTRELAIQVATETNKFLKFKKDLFAVPIYGGQPIAKQIAHLRRGAQIVIGTPGRVLDHLDRRTLSLSLVKLVVLDEADEMLNMGFRADIEKILQGTQPNRQTLLFSATMSNDVLRLTQRYQKNPKQIRVEPEKQNVSAIEQICFDVEAPAKQDALRLLLDQYNPYLSIVFCNTKHKVDKVARMLQKNGYLAEGIHGDIRQSKRDAIMGRFRSNRTAILVATDVAARGIDVANIDIVFNYEIPKDVESYVHRIGRTGRAGKTGKAMSLVSREDQRKINDIRRHTKAQLIQQKMPTAKS